MSTKIRTVLFDLDGTLVDTNELIIQSFLHTLEKYFPGRYRREDTLPFIGPPLIDTFMAIDKNRAEEMVRVYREFNNAQHDIYVKEFEGVYDTVKTLHQEGYKLAVVTTKVLHTVKKGLSLSRLEPFFDVVVTLDDVKNAKPDPEPIYKALNQLNSSPEESIMVGDNYHDILAGRNAGTKTAGVAWSLKGENYLRQFQPDYILKKMPDLLPIVGVDGK